MSADNQVTVFSIDAADLHGPGIRHRKVWALGGSGFARSITFSLTSTLLLFLSHFREWGRFDVIHTHGDYTGLEDVMTSHYCQAAEMERLRQAPKKSSFGHRIQRLAMKLLEKRMVKRSRIRPIIVPSERMKQDLLALQPLFSPTACETLGGRRPHSPRRPSAGRLLPAPQRPRQYVPGERPLLAGEEVPADGGQGPVRRAAYAVEVDGRVDPYTCGLSRREAYDAPGAVIADNVHRVAA